LASGIDCQRCHGPGAAHAAGKGSIVNPAKLTPERGMEICLQCHLESASRSIPDSIRRFDRGPYSFRPGEPLGDFTIYFDRARPDPDDSFTVNHSAYGLFESRCFQNSAAGKLTCTTCHNPHKAIRRDAAEHGFTLACRKCHESVHPEKSGGCARCHMPLRRTDDAVHVLMTDHRIRRTPPRNPRAAKIERHGRYAGPVRLLYPPRLEGTPEDRLYLAIADLTDKERLPASAAALERMLAEIRPSQAGFYLQLAAAQRSLGRSQEALKSYREALARDPINKDALIGVAGILLDSGSAAPAITLLEKASSRDPDVLNALAVAYTGAARYQDAEQTLRRALEVDDESPATWLNLGITLEAQSKLPGAAQAYERALALEPNFERARVLLRRSAR
jgi:tetratricopeptide (TPR) repeat protein